MNVSLFISLGEELHLQGTIASLYNEKSMAKLHTSLFTRLLVYFLIIMTTPFTIFMGVYLAKGETTIIKALRVQAESIASADAEVIAHIINTYKTKARYLANDESIIASLTRGDLEEGSAETIAIYNQLYATMQGDTYKAEAHLLSRDGTIKLSTHSFPEIYDTRIHSNTWEKGNILALERSGREKGDTLYMLENHRRNEDGKMVFCTLLEKIRNEEGDVIGFLIVEIFSTTLSSALNRTGILTEEALFDMQSYYGASMLYGDREGNTRTFTETEDQMIEVEVPVRDTPFTLFAVAATAPLEKGLEQWTSTLVITLSLGVVIAIILALLFTHSISRPIKSLSLHMQEVEKGNLSVTMEDSSITDFRMLSRSFNIMIGQISSLLDLTREEEAKIAQAERKALESQLNPHFLFNTLNTIKALARLHKEDEIYTISLKLGQLLRGSLSSHESECTIKESMALVESYLAIQQIRFGGKLHITISIDSAVEFALTPKLIIQPLVENAIIHGLEPKAGEWHLAIIIAEEDGKLDITVTDDGIGYPEGSIPENINELSQSGHVGVYNIYRRLQLRFGQDAEFTIKSREGEGTKVHMVMPIVMIKEENK